MIGANDFCSDMCYLSKPSLTISNHERDLTIALRILRDNLPRSFVSISPPPHIKNLYGITGRQPYCDLMLSFECPCIFGTRWIQQRSTFFEIMTKFVKHLSIFFFFLILISFLPPKDYFKNFSVKIYCCPLLLKQPTFT